MKKLLPLLTLLISLNASAELLSVTPVTATNGNGYIGSENIVISKTDNGLNFTSRGQSSTIVFYKEEINAALPDAAEVIRGEEPSALFVELALKLEKVRGEEFTSAQEAALAIMEASVLVN
jgi:hypothetical protein